MHSADIPSFEARHQLLKQQAALGERHVYATRLRFITPAIFRHDEQCVWLTAERAQIKTPVPEAVRMLVRERARAAWE